MDMTYINQINVFNSGAVETFNEITFPHGELQVSSPDEGIESTVDNMIDCAGKTYENFMSKKQRSSGNYKQTKL